jgi:predicted phosphate transport protein (TIGR00153 family)|tara:strand:+ start:307 stop:975 length:669 start_codon:yes stop_codon:yes gene_type:complete
MFNFKNKKLSMFSDTKKLEKDIDEFVNILSEVGLAFKSIVRRYLSHSTDENFDALIEKVTEMESRADIITKEIEHALYEETLIPDARSDVLRLLEHLDELIGMYQGNCYHFSIQKPQFPKEFHEDLIGLTENVVNCVETLCLTVRSFFRDSKSVRDNAHKVTYYEKESDIKFSSIARRIFNSDLNLDQKMHLRYFVEKIDRICDQAEDIADELIIYSIKRSV